MAKVPLGFANVVRRGRIGLAAASGTGLQQVSCLVDQAGEGISQAIGVGGRDLDEAVGGAMLLAAIERLAGDPATEVLVLLSKPPAPVVARAVLGAARATRKPVVVNFLGSHRLPRREGGLVLAPTLEDAAAWAVALARGQEAAPAPSLSGELRLRAKGEAERLLPGQWRIRGLYSGGTLCKEAALLLHDLLPDRPHAHDLIDLGDDTFTVGGRIGYSLATGVCVAIVAWLGLAALLLAIIPLVAILPILLYIGLVIGAQAFQASPARHAPAIVLALLPNIASWAQTQVDTALSVAGVTSGTVPPALAARLGDASAIVYQGMARFGGGAVLAGLMLGAIAAFIIDRNFRGATIYAAAAAVLTFFGLIHGTAIGVGVNLDIAIGYLLMGGITGYLALTIKESSDGVVRDAPAADALPAAEAVRA